MTLDRAAAAEELWDRLIKLAESIPDDAWNKPTPCERWDVHDVIGHLPAIQHLFDGGPLHQPPEGWQVPEGLTGLDAWTESGVVARRGWPRDRLLSDVRAAARGHVAHLRSVTDWDERTPGPLGETTRANLFDNRMMDLWVHLQDLHLALGEPVDAPDLSPAAERAHRFLLASVPYLFAKRMPTTEASSLRITLSAPVDVDSVLQIVNGRAGWHDEADAGADVVGGDPAAVSLLLVGRRSPERFAEEGLLHLVR